MAYFSHNLADTIVALATPTGIGAIGVIRLSGSRAIEICDLVFKGKKLALQASHTIHFGTIRSDEGKILDEVLMSLFRTPTSYTKEDTVEISTHGSPYIQQQIIQLLLQKGARMAQAGEFTLRAFLNGQLDLSQAEAVADLIASDSDAAHSLAMQQMRGGFSDKIKALRAELIRFASLIELDLDFGEEDVEFANRDDLKALVQEISSTLQTLSDSFQLGNVLKKGVATVIAGRPNAGKSTLLNGPLNEQRAIVSDIAGTTRDTIEEVLNINGIAFRLIDTAGIREANDTIERIGIEKTMQKAREAAVLVYMYDASLLSMEDVQVDLEKLENNTAHIVIIANHCDKINNTSVIPTSHFQMTATSETWKTPLQEKLYEAVMNGKATSPSSTIVANARHYEALQRALTALGRVQESMAVGITSDFIAMDIRQAVNELATITGEISSDDLLISIFSSFCIGK